MVLQEILRNRGFGNLPFPLWKLKITDDEYLQIKQELKDNEHRSLVGLRDELLVYFAEWWRREYEGDVVSYDMVFSSLGIRRGGTVFDDLFNVETIEYYYHNRLQIVRNRNNQLLYSVLYQGGVPLKAAANGNVQAWREAISRMLDGNFDFSNIGIPETASRSDSIKAFFNDIIWAYQTNDMSRLPFDITGEQNAVWNQIRGVLDKEKDRNPFSIDWEFIIDVPNRYFKVHYKFNGCKKLTEKFCNKFDEPNNLNIELKYGDSTIGQWRYFRKFCSRTVEKRGGYDNTANNVSVVCNGRIILSDSLDMDSTPYLMYRDETDGKYYLGNKMGNEVYKSLIIMPCTYTVEGHENELVEYDFNGNNYKLLFCQNDCNIYRVIDEDGELLREFSSGRKLLWTEYEHDLTANNWFRESDKLCLPDEMKFLLCSDNLKVCVNSDKIEYKSRYGGEWSDEIPVGLVCARYKTGAQDVSVAKFINTGTPINVEVINSSRDKCEVRLTWDSGTLHTINAEPLENGNWLVRRSNLIEDLYLPFRCTPDKNEKNSFEVNLKAPLRGFFITDMEGNEVPDGSYIPFDCLAMYKYRIFAQGDYNIALKYSNRESAELICDGNTGNITIKRNHCYETPTPIQNEGPLSNLLLGEKNVERMLERTFADVKEAKIELEMTDKDGFFRKYIIMRYPYRLEIGSNRINVVDINRRTVNYKHPLKLFSFGKRRVEPIRKNNREQNYFTVPEDIARKNPRFIIGNYSDEIGTARDFTFEPIYNGNLLYRVKVKYGEREVSWIDPIYAVWYENKGIEGYITQNAEGYYIIPDEINGISIEDENLGSILVYGDLQGSIYPSTIQSLSGEELQRIENQIESELRSANLNSPIINDCIYWFDKVVNASSPIPFSSIYELKCLSKSPHYLVGFVMAKINKLLNEDDSDDSIKRLEDLLNITEFEYYLAFRWIWLLIRVEDGKIKWPRYRCVYSKDNRFWYNYDSEGKPIPIIGVEKIENIRSKYISIMEDIYNSIRNEKSDAPYDGSSKDFYANKDIFKMIKDSLYGNDGLESLMRNKGDFCRKYMYYIKYYREGMDVIADKIWKWTNRKR